MKSDESRQQLVDLFKEEYDVKLEVPIKYEKAGKIDVIIQSKDLAKKVYVAFKNEDIRPAMFADVI